MTQETRKCSIHNVPLIDEPGGPEMPTLYGRTYCPKCQEAFNAALDAFEAERKPRE